MGVTPPAYGPAHEDEDGSPVLGVRVRDAPLAGSLSRVRRVGHRGGGRVHPRGVGRGSGPGAHRRRRRAGGESHAHRRRRARPGAPRWPGPRVGHAVGGRAGDGKEHVAAPGARAPSRQRGTRCLLVTAEESCAQVKLRAERVGALHPNLLVVADTSLPHVLAHAHAVAPGVSRSTPSRPSSTPTCPARPARSPRCATARTVSCSTPRSTAVPPCWWVTSPRKARSPVPECWSTWSTPCSRSTATAGTRSARCTRSSTASVAPTRSGCSR